MNDINYGDEIKSAIDCEDYLFQLKDSLLLITAINSHINTLRLDCSEEVSEVLEGISFLLNLFLDTEPRQGITRCVRVLGECRARDRRNNQAN